MGEVIGLLGGVASGKSCVAELLARHGFLVLDADAEARAVVADPEVLAALVERFGADILDSAGNLDRPELARRAFASEKATADLNARVHPAVRRRLEQGLAAAGKRPVVLDVPLLLESPLARHVSTWVYVESPEAHRDLRTVGRNWSPGERARREARQADLTAKRTRADHILDNSGSMKDLEAAVDGLVLQLNVG